MGDKNEKHAKLLRFQAGLSVVMGLSFTVSTVFSVQEANVPMALLNGSIALANLIIAPFLVREARK